MIIYRVEGVIDDELTTFVIGSPAPITKGDNMEIPDHGMFDIKGVIHGIGDASPRVIISKSAN